MFKDIVKRRYCDIVSKKRWEKIVVKEKIGQKVVCRQETKTCKGTCQKRFSGFFPLRGYPPTPLTENHFAKKPLAEMGGSPPLKGKLPKIFLKKWVKKG